MKPVMDGDTIMKNRVLKERLWPANMLPPAILVLNNQVLLLVHKVSIQEFHR